MNFIFECSTRYLTLLRSFVRYRLEHQKIKLVSTRGHVTFCLFYRHRWRGAVILFSYWLRLKWPWQPWYLHMYRIKIVSSLDTKFSSLEKSWYFINVYVRNTYIFSGHWAQYKVKLQCCTPVYGTIMFWSCRRISIKLTSVIAHAFTRNCKT